jgi:hypothetical protein
MATSRTVTFEYSESPDEVAAWLQDPVYLRHRSETAGEHNIDVRVEPAGDRTRVTVSREKDVDVPAFAKFVLGSAKRAVEQTTWRKTGAQQWTAEYTIELSGVPVKASGKSVLSVGGRGCKHVSTFEVEARIPLVGKKLEAFVADGLEEQMSANAQRNTDALSRSAGGNVRSYIEALKGGSASSAES